MLKMAKEEDNICPECGDYKSDHPFSILCPCLASVLKAIDKWENHTIVARAFAQDLGLEKAIFPEEDDAKNG